MSHPRFTAINRHPTRGFTLIELMVVVVIIAILAAIGYPSYQEHIRKTRRADAQGALMELAQFMERHFTLNNSYLASGGSAPTLPFTESPKDGSTKYYNLGFAAAPNAPTASTFTLQAVPKGPQADDKCGTLTLTQTGVRSAVKGGSAVADCW
ncbi:MAG: type IV pilin protein [Chromatiales bacterium]|jgi:type IV pilus assembly protein PilE|nr:type IV pilin protein [Chromatiales bacterium]